MADKIEQISNNDLFTWIVDPNPTGKDIYAPEDLFVYVDFRALPKSRSIIETDGTYSSDLFDAKGVQFITSTEQNGKGYLTTNYTNIGGSQSSEREAFGITDIQMEYGASLVPEVSITFVDVRGAALFNGYEYNDENGTKYNSSEFSTFFRLPHPIFELTVKGFYGRAVKYCLHLRTWNAAFDATTGNFIITAKFVGYTFAFLSDILMNYVLDITSSSIADNALTNAGIMPLNDFLSSLGKITTISESLKSNSTSFKELKVVNSLIFQLDKLQKIIAQPVDINYTSEFGNILRITQLKINTDQLFVRDVGIISKQKEDVYDIIVEDLTKFVAEYNKFIDDNQKTQSYISSYKITDSDVSKPTLAKKITESVVNEINQEVLKDGITGNLKLISLDVLESRLNVDDTSTKEFYIINYFKFRKQVADLLAKIGEKKNALEIKVNEELNEQLSQELGFDLSIQTVFNIIIGNVEAFLEVVYNVAVEADNANIQAQRVGNLTNVRTDVSSVANRIFPFPSVYDSVTGNELWLGDVVGEDNPAFPEIDLVRQVINSSVASNNTQTKNRKQNNSRVSTTTNPTGWVTLNPIDYSNNGLQFIDTLQFIGNTIPDILAVDIVKRALLAYNNSCYKGSSINNVAQLESAYAASQIVNETLKQVVKNIANNDFVDEVLIDSGFVTDNPELYQINGYDIKSNDGFLIEGYSDIDTNLISSIINQSDKVLPTAVDDTINGFGLKLNDIFITKNKKRYHRTLETNRNANFIVGDLTARFWTDEIQKNIQKYHKSKTTNDLKDDISNNTIVLENVNDLTIFDGQINAAIDYTKPKSSEEKFTNNARKSIAINGISVDSSKCLFDTQYYNSSSDVLKAYLLISTLPMDKIVDWNKIFEISGVYSISKMQLVWIAAQFYRVKQQSTSTDWFETSIDLAFLNTYYDNRYVQFRQQYANLKLKTSYYLPNLDNFTSVFIDKMSAYFENWVANEYITNNGIEDKFKQYCTMSEFSNPTYLNYTDYTLAYNDILLEFSNIQKICVINPLNVVKESSVLYSDLALSVMDETTLRQYLEVWIVNFKKNVTVSNQTNVKLSGNGQNTSQDQEFYITDSAYKLAAYGHFKNLYDKWIGGSGNAQVFNSCGCNGDISKEKRLIDRFHFINRAWSYIGDTAVVDPKALLVLSKEVGIPLYSYIGRICRASKFDFHVLPTYVNYKNIQEVQDMWKPHTDLTNVNAGAAYIAMYVGGTSKVLDIGEKSFYVNDGFDMREFDSINIPKDFTDKRIPTNYTSLDSDERFKYNMVVFRVGYADQNQSIFTSIKDLSQQENRETEESRIATAEIFDGRGGTKRFYKGTNLYNVFALRSYKCSVECMGNMQIHPLNYFQLDNIPFFHGAYLITKVSHDITPNMIKTTFTGARMPRFVYPIVDKATSFVNIPLSDTLFNAEELNKNVIRPLNGEDEGFYSLGEDTGAVVGYNDVPSAAEFAALETANNVVFVAQSATENYTFYANQMTESAFLQLYNSRFNANTPVSYADTKVGYCARWVKYALRDIGITVKPFGFNAWNLFAAMNDAELKFVDTTTYQAKLKSNGSGSWSNADLSDIGIPDGSIVFSTYITSKSKSAAISVIQNNASQVKINALKNLLNVDTNEKQLGQPFLAVTHVAIYANGHLHHQVKSVITQPNSTKIIAYYPFKSKTINKLRMA